MSAELNLTPILLAALASGGVVLILTALERARQRSTTMRRVAVLVGTDGSERLAPLESPGTLNAMRVRAVQAIARIRAHDDALRGPVLALCIVAGLVGIATLTVAWIVVAAILAAAAYGLNARARRRERVEAQALGAMQLLSSGLRAGYSVPQAIALVARQSPQPTASEFLLASQEISVGVGLADALRLLSPRTANSDYELVSIIVRVQHEVGGNLARILDSVSDTLRERFELRRQVASLTAQQRLSSLVLTILPFALLALLTTMDRSFVAPLFTETAGRVMLVVAAIMIFIGWSIMRRVAAIEV